MKWTGKILAPALAIFFVGAVGFAPSSSAQVELSLRVAHAPPLIPTYELPPTPGYGYVWTPGYWAWDDYFEEYYWVPGSWQEPPRVGYLWTPGYWAFDAGYYTWHPGYWAPEVGFYGGINYGYGYFGVGFIGGHWYGNRYFHNHRLRNYWGNRCSFNGPGGYAVHPTKKQRAFKKRYAGYAHTRYQQRYEQDARHRYFERHRDKMAASKPAHQYRTPERIRHKDRRSYTRSNGPIRNEQSYTRQDFRAREPTKRFNRAQRHAEKRPMERVIDNRRRAVRKEAYRNRIAAQAPRAQSQSRFYQAPQRKARAPQSRHSKRL